MNTLEYLYVISILVIFIGAQIFYIIHSEIRKNKYKKLFMEARELNNSFINEALVENRKNRCTECKAEIDQGRFLPICDKCWDKITTPNARH